MKSYLYIIVFSLIFLSYKAHAMSIFDLPIGKQVSYNSPNNLTELCIMVDKFPGSDANYSSQDIQDETNFCAVDIYKETVALCPKTWSTSPATMLYDIFNMGFTSAEYEAQFCKKSDKHKTLAKFKQTMNQAGTSGTFSPSSLLYYHFSRYFQADVYVPVAVYRSMDRFAHLERVISAAMAQDPGGMNGEGWKHLLEGAKNPDAYKPKDELYTDSDRQIYGSFLEDKGERYGPEVNGTRESGWGVGQNNDFQKTAPFTALKTEGDLLKILPQAIETAFANSKIKTSTGEVSNAQMIFWMQELTEITLLDYIFAQQDRVGNIDFRWYWYWIDGEGKIKRRVVSEKNLKDLQRSKQNQILAAIPEDIKSFPYTLLQRTQLNDNDAGARSYSNFTKMTKMLEGMRHYPARTYRKLIDLDNDFKLQGPLYQYVSSRFGINSKYVNAAIKNTSEAAAILKGLCQKGVLKFDLNPHEYLLTQKVNVQSVNCD